ncbi:MAG: sigma-E processing peptidase SpoIIGA [Clostridia bacterium]|nr:sigma-E processing peptidase SpoIIGA [Clostridia bacterium]
MRVSLEWFLLDNVGVNLLLLRLAGALGGVGTKPVRALLLSLLGAVWDALALSRWPRLLSLPGRVGCLLVTALLMSRREVLRSLLSLFAASLLMGGGMLLLTMGQAGPGGVFLSTVPLRAAVYGLCLLPPLIRGVRYLVHRGYEGRCLRSITLTVGKKSFRLTAFVDSGNLLTEPLSGLPVVLVEGIDLPAGRPLAVEGQGVIEVAPGTVQTGPNREPVPVYVGRSPLHLGEFQALLPGAALHEGRMVHVQKAQSVPLSRLRAAVHPAVSGLSRSGGGEPAAAVESGGGATLRPSGEGQRSGPEPAHRAQPSAGGVHRPEV